jgi:ABC-type Na+ transport system ATPase subunit NatA
MVRAEGIGKNYKTISALQGISFDVPQGEIFGIIGPDGAGKTTLFRILTTVLLPDAGTAEVDSLDVVRDFRKIRRRVGYMPGRFSLYQDLTVEENLTFFASVFGSRIEDSYRLIGDIYERLEPFKDRRAGALSGGMKQKLALSCALIHEPRVLFLDEPTTGVDPVSRRSSGRTQTAEKEGLDHPGLHDLHGRGRPLRRSLTPKGRRFLTIDAPDRRPDGFSAPLYSIRGERMFALLGTLRDCRISAAVRLRESHHEASRNSIDAGTAGAAGAAGCAGVEVSPIATAWRDPLMELSEREVQP